jgi:hypothetical protein
MTYEEISRAEICLSALASDLSIRAFTKASITIDNKRALSFSSILGQFLALYSLSKVGL